MPSLFPKIWPSSDARVSRAALLKISCSAEKGVVLLVEEVARVVVEVGRSGLVLETEVKALLCSGS